MRNKAISKHEDTGSLCSSDESFLNKLFAEGPNATFDGKANDSFEDDVVPQDSPPQYAAGTIITSSTTSIIYLLIMHLCEYATLQPCFIYLLVL